MIYISVLLESTLPAVSLWLGCESLLHEEGAIPDSKLHGVNMGPFWGRQDPGRPHVGPMNFAIRDKMMRYKSDGTPEFIQCGIIIMWSIFSKFLTVDTPELTCEGEIWDVCCEYKFLFTFSLSN